MVRFQIRRFPMLRTSTIGLIMALLVQAQNLPAKEKDPPTYEQIQPLFEQHCVVCHSGEGAPLSLRLDSYQTLLRGSSRGPVVVSGDSQSSELLKRLKGESTPRMPLTGPPFLSSEEVRLLARWIDAGLPQGEGGGAAEAKRAAAEGREAASSKAEGPLRFSDVAPIFLKHCVKCHKDKGLRGSAPEGLRLTDWQQVVGGGERVVVVPGFPEASELVRRIEGRSRPRMPLDGPPYLPSAAIEKIRQWIIEGARDAQGSRAAMPVGRRVRLEGRLTARWTLDDLPLQVTADTRIKKAPQPGDYVRVRGFVTEDGAIRVERIGRR